MDQPGDPVGDLDLVAASAASGASATNAASAASAASERCDDGTEITNN